MDLRQAIAILEKLYYRPHDLLEDLKKWDGLHKNQVIWRLHLPIYLLILPFLLLSPFAIYYSLFSLKYYAIPCGLLVISLVLASSHDYVQYYFGSPVSERAEKINHFSLLAHLSVGASFPFFFFHPGLGIIFLLISLVYAQFLAVDLYARAKKKSHAVIWGHNLMSMIFFLIPLAIVLFILNVWQNILFFYKSFF